MLVLPAIDIRGGKCVRLVQGDYDRETVFGDPAAMARRWVCEGARALHLVDLDGARAGGTANYRAVEAILSELEASAGELGLTERVLVELGGGIRDVATAGRWLDAGVDRVILGTVAVSEPDVVSQASALYPGRVWVGVDARAGEVAVSGWTRGAGVGAVELARDMSARGAGGIIYTDIERDGTRTGVNLETTASLAAAVDIPVYASGGVASASDVKRLRALDIARIEGVVVGRALYDGATTLADLLAAAA